MRRFAYGLFAGALLLTALAGCDLTFLPAGSVAYVSDDCLDCYEYEEVVTEEVYYDPGYVETVYVEDAYYVEDEYYVEDAVYVEDGAYVEDSYEEVVYEDAEEEGEWSEETYEEDD